MSTRSDYRYDHLVGTQYDEATVQAAGDWAGVWPLVEVREDGTVGDITGIVCSDDDDASEWALVDVTDGRAVVSMYACEAAALRSELVAAGLLDADDAE